MHRYKTPLAFIALLMLFSLPSRAEVPALSPLNEALRYDVTIGGLPLGRLRMTAVEDAFSYRLILDTKSRGLVDLFSPIESLASSRGRMDAGRYLPSLYTTRDLNTSQEERRRTEIRYDAEGAITNRSRIPVEDPKWRPVVPLEELNHAVDPLTGIFVLRQALRDAMANNQRDASVRTYDGARLATLRLKVISRARVEVDGRHVDAINTVLTREPLNGYTPKELKKFAKGDPVIHLFFSADADFIPLKATISLHYGDITASLTEREKPAK